MERKIQVVHLPQGHGIDRALLMNEIEGVYDKLYKRLNGEIFMEVHFKEFHKEGKKEQVECKAHIKGAGFKFNAGGLEWGAMQSLNQALSSLEKEVNKSLERQK